MDCGNSSSIRNLLLISMAILAAQTSGELATWLLSAPVLGQELGPEQGLELVLVLLSIWHQFGPSGRIERKEGCNLNFKKRAMTNIQRSI